MRIFSPVWLGLNRWYRKHERPISTLSLFGGFAFNVFTLKRVDMFLENFWVSVHLVIVAGAILLLNLEEHRGGEHSTFHFWVTNLMQFFFGGLFSTFLVFYFRSATLVTWPFLLLLGFAFIANESFFKKHYERLAFQIGLLFLSVLSWSMFVVPIIFHRIGTVIFFVSGAIALLLILGFFMILRKVSRRDFEHESRRLLYVVGGIYLVVNFLYFTHLIPPLPLALKDSGVYHSIYKDSDGNYVGTYEDIGWKAHVQIYDDFHIQPGYPIYVYSAIFSPAEFKFDVIHEWQHLDEENMRWDTTNLIHLPINGGREGGFRTYSLMTDLTPGKWRVNVETSSGALIGRIGFTIVPANTTPELSTKVNY